MKQSMKIHNRFDIEVRDAITGELKHKRYAENILLDSIYTRLCTPNTVFGFIQFGTGTGTLAPSRTSLFTYLGDKEGTIEEVINDKPVSQCTKKIQINPEEYIGSVLTEVGISALTGSANLLTHALIKDSEGNPLALPPKTALDVIVIYATVFITITDGAGVEWIPSDNNIIRLYFKQIDTIGTTGDAKARFMTGLIVKSDASWSFVPDVANKKLKITSADLAVNTGNVKPFPFTRMLIGRVGDTNSSWGLWSAAFIDLEELYPASPVEEGVVTGVVDGTNRLFDVEWNNVNATGFKLYADGVEVPSGQYTLNPAKINNPCVLSTDWVLVEKNINELTLNSQPIASTRITSLPEAYLIFSVGDITRTYGISTVTLYAYRAGIKISIKRFDSPTWEEILSYDTTSSNINTRTVSTINWSDVEFIKIEGKKNTGYTELARIDDYAPLTPFPTHLIEFNEGYAPSGVTLTADYTVKGLPKTADYIIKSALELTFSDGA